MKGVRMKTETSTTERFSGRARSYAKGRPQYPGELFEHLFRAKALWEGAVVADIGSGTGIFTKQLLERGTKVFGVEPNRDMRSIAEEELKDEPRFHSVAGKAEEVPLPPSTVDAVTAAQAFHWFDPLPAMREFRRISRPGSYLILVWNERMGKEEAFDEAYARLVDDFEEGRGDIESKKKRPERMFGDLPFEHLTFSFERRLRIEELCNLVSSVSYLPVLGEAKHEEMMNRLSEIFESHQIEGAVRMHYRTHCCLGRIWSTLNDDAQRPAKGI